MKEIQESQTPLIRDLELHEENILHWQGLLVPDAHPYNISAFKVELTFPPEYPFRPPKIIFKTPIYHPNIDEQGQVCLSIVNTENWKPATKTEQVTGIL